MNASRRRGACPGLSAPMPTGDGLLARFLPAEPVAPGAFAGFCAAARRYGNGTIEISARGSLQVRGLSPHSAPLLAAAVAELGIVTHEGVPVHSNPLVPDADLLIDTADAAAELRRTLANAGLVLSPKVSVVVDGGGRLHLDALSADVRLRAEGPARRPRFYVGLGGDGASATWLGAVAPNDAADAVVDLLKVVARHGPAARAADVLRAEGIAAFDSALASRTSFGQSESYVGWAKPTGPAFGRPDDRLRVPTIAAARWARFALPTLRHRFVRSSAPSRRMPAEMVGLHRMRDDTVAVGIGLAFGYAHADALAELVRIAAAHGARAVRPAPDRALLLIGVAPPDASGLTAAAERLGFVVRADDPRRRVAACPGAPACASGLMPARALAAALMPALETRMLPEHGICVHVSGCPKGCAHPAPAALTLVGTARGCGIVRNGCAYATPGEYLDPTNLAVEISRIAAPASEAGHA